MGTRISEAACIIMSHAVRASLGAGGREGAYSAEAAKAHSPSHLTQHTQRLPFQSYARDSPCSGAGSALPCSGSCWTSRPSQTPIAAPFPHPRHPSSVVNPLISFTRLQKFLTWCSTMGGEAAGPPPEAQGTLDRKGKLLVSGATVKVTGLKGAPQHNGGSCPCLSRNFIECSLGNCVCGCVANIHPYTSV